MQKLSATLLLAVAFVLSTGTASAVTIPPRQTVPDAGSSVLLLGAALTGLASCRCFFSKKR